MVRLEEVEDEAFTSDQPGPIEEEADWESDEGKSKKTISLHTSSQILTQHTTESDTSSIASDPADDDLDESLYDRVVALKDVIPPTQRRQLGTTLNTTYTWGSWGMQGGLKLAWQISVSVLLLVAPFALASQEDMAIAMEEKQMLMQQSANEVSG